MHDAWIIVCLQAENWTVPALAWRLVESVFIPLWEGLLSDPPPPRLRRLAVQHGLGWLLIAAVVHADSGRWWNVLEEASWTCTHVPQQGSQLQR